MPLWKHLTLDGRGQDEICDVCFWEDDGQDNHDADEIRGGPNKKLSLSQARRNYLEFGAIDNLEQQINSSSKQFVQFVTSARLPLPEEV